MQYCDIFSDLVALEVNVVDDSYHIKFLLKPCKTGRVSLFCWLMISVVDDASVSSKTDSTMCCVQSMFWG